MLPEISRELPVTDLYPEGNGILMLQLHDLKYDYQ
jgi:hypothetical protein